VARRQGRIVLRPAVDAGHRLRSPRGQTIVAISAAGKAIPLAPAPDGTVRVRLRRGERYDVKFG
jgi:hypothetical protein